MDTLRVVVTPEEGWEEIELEEKIPGGFTIYHNKRLLMLIGFGLLFESDWSSDVDHIEMFFNNESFYKD